MFPFPLVSRGVLKWILVISSERLLALVYFGHCYCIFLGFFLFFFLTPWISSYNLKCKRFRMEVVLLLYLKVTDNKKIKRQFRSQIQIPRLIPGGLALIVNTNAPVLSQEGNVTPSKDKTPEIHAGISFGLSKNKKRKGC